MADKVTVDPDFEYDFGRLFENVETVVEMKKFLKNLTDGAKAFIKVLETSQKAELVTSVKDSMKEGDSVNVSYKGGVISGDVVSLRDKTFTILTKDVLNVHGEASKIARGYNLVVSV